MTNKKAKVAKKKGKVVGKIEPSNVAEMQGNLGLRKVTIEIRDGDVEKGERLIETKVTTNHPFDHNDPTKNTHAQDMGVMVYDYICKVFNASVIADQAQQQAAKILSLDDGLEDMKSEGGIIVPE